jgi:hypothetical protein
VIDRVVLFSGEGICGSGNEYESMTDLAHLSARVRALVSGLSIVALGCTGATAGDGTGGSAGGRTTGAAGSGGGGASGATGAAGSANAGAGNAGGSGAGGSARGGSSGATGQSGSGGTVTGGSGGSARGGASGGSGAFGGGGASGRGGASGASGGGVSGGASGRGGTTGLGGSGGPATCTVHVTSSTVSTVIPTVGIVEWQTDLAHVDSASVEFGLDTKYGQVAPVDLNEPKFRTVVLGMKASRTYHAHVVATGGSATCESDDFTLTTGAPPSSLATLLQVTTPLPDQRAGGYLMTSFFANTGGPAFILDKDRDLVWWYTSKGDDVFRARMSYDGKSMWIRNVANQDTGAVYRVSMDGLKEDVWKLPKSTHDLAVIPDEHVALITRVAGGCDAILELDPATGQTTTVANLEDAIEIKMCHVNAVAYNAPDDTFIVSDYNASSYVKLSRTGKVLWVLNGAQSNFKGYTWQKQHNLQMLGNGRMLIFNNGPNNAAAKLIELQLDEQAFTVQEVWEYAGGPAVLAGGDVQRLPNGNTLGTYGIASEIREVNPSGQIVQKIAAGSKPFGNTVFRTSLYGPPPRIGRDF